MSTKFSRRGKRWSGRKLSDFRVNIRPRLQTAVCTTNQTMIAFRKSCPVLFYRRALAACLVLSLWLSKIGLHVESFAVGKQVPFFATRHSPNSKTWMNPVNQEEGDCDPSVLALKSFVRLAARLPDRSRYEGKSTSIPLIPVDSDDLLAWLLQNADPAPFGEGNATVLDQTIRKTLQIFPDDSCQPQWDGLQQALLEISQALTPGIRLEADFDKILIYRPGDFFAEHCDSKKSANHTLTLSVLCGGYEPVGGGVVRFRNHNDDDDKDRSVNGVDSNCWEAVEPGSFACWFNTEPHLVKQIRNGYRVLLQYNVIVVERVSMLSQVVSNSWAGRSWNFPKSWRNEFSTLLPTSDDRTQDFSGSDASHPYNLFVEFLQREKQNILNAIAEKSFGRSKLGLLLKHEYSLDGTSQVPRLHLRGTDAWFCSALDDVFGKNQWTTRRAILWTTVHPPCNIYDDYDPESLLEAKVLQEITDNRIGDRGEFKTENIPSDYVHLVPSGKTKITYLSLRLLQEPTEIETDCEIRAVKDSEGPFLGDELLYWPFFRTLFLIRDGDLARVTTTRMTNGKREGLIRWGNQREYEVFAYTTVAVLLDLGDDGDSDSETDDDPTLVLNRSWQGYTKDDMVTLVVSESDGDDGFSCQYTTHLR